MHCISLITWFRSILLGIALSAGLMMAACAAVTTDSQTEAATAEAPKIVGPKISSNINEQQIIREGVKVEFKATPASSRPEIREGEFADIEFHITSAENGEPLQGVYPGVWIDLTQTPDGEESGVSFDCRTRVSQYLQGLVGMRPMIDLNSYYVMVLNRDPSISVIDPVVGITGITSLYANIPLKRPGADWAKTTDEKTMFVTLPRADEIAVVDLDTFKVIQEVPAGVMPTRIALQPDEKYLWIGNNAPSGESGGVTVIDTVSRKSVATIATGPGHHEIAFSDDNRSAFITNRDAGTVSVIDIASLQKIVDIETGEVPISLAYSPLSKSVYVADGATGEVAVIDAERRTLITRITAKAGLGPLRFSENGRWGFAVNPAEDEVYVIDASSNDIAHTIEIKDKPYQVNVSRTFAYIRSLESAQVSMINLQELDRNGQVIINYFAAGSFPPDQAEDISIADALVPAAQEAAMLVVSPADATVYYYMEGMNAPMGAFRNYGHQPRAVQIANRALKEARPGVYSATVRVPEAGTFEVAFLNETPEFLHCFTMEAEKNPLIQAEVKPVKIDYLMEERSANAGENLNLRFRLSDPHTGEAQAELTDVTVKYYRAPRYDLKVLTAQHVADGIYEAELPLRRPGGYYIFVSAPSLKLGYNDLDYLTVMAQKAVAGGKTSAVENP